MSAHGPGALRSLIGDPGLCPVCDEAPEDCHHGFLSADQYRIGDPKEKHPILGRRFIPAPRRIEQDGRLLFAEGALMTADEAQQHGVAIPQGTAPRKKGHRQRPATIQGPQGPQEDRAHHPADNRKA